MERQSDFNLVYIISHLFFCRFSYYWIILPVKVLFINEFRLRVDIISMIASFVLYLE